MYFTPIDSQNGTDDPALGINPRPPTVIHPHDGKASCQSGVRPAIANVMAIQKNDEISSYETTINLCLANKDL